MTVKPVQKSEGDYVRAHVTSVNETLVRLLWVTKSNKKTGRPEARLLCLTRYRVLTFKGKFFNRNLSAHSRGKSK